MILKLRFDSGYPTKLGGLKKRTLVFQGWTNILVGPNGSGKTTILKSLAAVSGCGSGGWSDGKEPEEMPFSVHVEKDDFPVFYQDCYTHSEDSFIDVQYLETHANLRSSGEKRIGLVNELVDHIENRFPTYRLRREDRPTLLLDEVDNHIGLMGQSILWADIFPKLSKKYQLIISTHSIFPILLLRKNSLKPDTLIDLGMNYPQMCVHELEKAVKHFNQSGM